MVHFSWTIIWNDFVYDCLRCVSIPNINFVISSLVLSAYFHSLLALRWEIKDLNFLRSDCCSNIWNTNSFFSPYFSRGLLKLTQTKIFSLLIIRVADCWPTVAKNSEFRSRTRWLQGCSTQKFPRSFEQRPLATEQLLRVLGMQGRKFGLDTTV